MSRKKQVQKKGGYTRKKLTVKSPIDSRLHEMGKSRKWLASQLGKSVSTVALYANRKIVLSPGSLICYKLCFVLNVTVDFLIKGPIAQPQLSPGPIPSKFVDSKNELNNT